jgi:Uma2 family endonuclease
MMQSEATPIRTKRKALAKPRYNGRKMSLEKFMDFKPEDGFKYEWNNGFLEAREKMIKPSEFYLLQNLQRAFVKTALYANCLQKFPTEGKYRVPDMAEAQIEQAREGEQPVPIFIIELVSKSDT